MFTEDQRDQLKPSLTPQVRCHVPGRAQDKRLPTQGASPAVQNHAPWTDILSAQLRKEVSRSAGGLGDPRAYKMGKHN